ncbi:MAG: UbiA family prenyltransferase, partial [Rickettsiaceae bacterium]|nr:UbiA family prenyltransferase [Rickettsiaceae bacterium]
MKARDILFLTRIDKPIGIFLLFWPCAFACCISSIDLDFLLIFKFLICSILARSGGCIINDFVDRKIDSKVERTKSRPLASGAISPLQALIILTLLSVPGILLFMSMSLYARLASLVALPLIILYPFAKRFTYYPQ